MKQKSVAVVGAAETTRMGKIPDQSVIGLHADAANRIRRAVETVLTAGRPRTPDLGGDDGTDAMTDAITAALA